MLRENKLLASASRPSPSKRRRTSSRTLIRRNSLRRSLLEQLEARLLLTVEIEPNDTLGTATTLPANQTIEGTVAHIRDLDHFRVALNQGDRFQVNPANTQDARFSPSLPPSVELLDSSGRVLALTEDGRNLSFVAHRAGDYFVRMDSDNAFGTFTADYSMQSTLTAFAGNTEAEPNNNTGQATALTAGTPFRGALAQNDAADVYSIALSAGDGFSLDFSGPADESPGVRLLDAAGNLVVSALGGYGLTHIVGSAGTYFVELVANSTGGGLAQYVGVANRSADATAHQGGGNGFEDSTPWILDSARHFAAGILDSDQDVDFYRIDLSSLARYTFTVSPVGNDLISDQSRVLTLFNENGQFMAYSTSGTLDQETTDANEFGTYYLAVSSTATSGTGAYGLRVQETPWYSNQRDQARHFIDFDRQMPSHQGFDWVNAFAVPAAIPFVVGMFDSRHNPYDVDVTTTLPSDADELVTQGYGNFGDIGAGGWGGGSRGQRSSSGRAVTNALQTSWNSLSYGSTPTLMHEYGHSVGMPHARLANAFMSYVGTAELLPIGQGFAFRGTDSRRPGFDIMNERNFLDWSLQPGSQVREAEPNDSTPQDLEPFLFEMTADLTRQPALATGSRPHLVLAGDFNGDNNQDVVVANNNSNSLQVFLGDGSGGFQAPTATNVNDIGWWTESIVVDDFNEDGRSDVASISYSQATVSILLGQANGTLGAPTNITLGGNPQGIATGDFNGDGDRDIATAVVNDQVRILLGDGTGGFGAPSSFATGDNPYSITVGDFNNDGHDDVATADQRGGTISYLLGDGSGSLGAVTTLTAGSNPRGITSGDFNADGRDDLAVAVRDTGTVMVYLAQADGSFAGGIEYDGNASADTISVGDTNRDGQPDLLVGGSDTQFRILLGNADGTFSRPVSLVGDNSEYSAASADFTGDGSDDLVIVNYWSDTLSLYISEPNQAKNDVAVVYGVIDAKEDVDTYSIEAAAGETFAFDIESAEFQYTLDATLRVLDAAGNEIAISNDAIDRNSGLDSVDPYLMVTFANAGTYVIEVTGVRGSAGRYRLKAVTSGALDGKSPKVIAALPDGGATIDATREIIVFLDDQIDPATITSSTVQVTGATTGERTGTARFSPLDSTLVWTADEDLAPDTYTVRLDGGTEGLADLFGNRLDGEVGANFAFPQVSGDGTAGGDFSYSFTVNAEDNSAATISRVVYDRDPYQRGQFTLFFSDHLSSTSVETSQFMLRGAGSDSMFDTADDRLSVLDPNFDKIRHNSGRRLDLYTRGIPDPDLYRIEATIADAAGHSLNIQEEINVGVSVSQLALYRDEALTMGGLTGSYVNQSLRNVTAQDDWRTTQTISGTRTDYAVDFANNSFGTRADVGVTGGTDANWDNFSVQWDGWINIPVDGTRLQTRSDDGSRLWVDVNNDGNFASDSTEFWDNGWGTGHGVIAGALTDALDAGKYRIRVQYEEGTGGNAMLLEWFTPGLAGQIQGYGHGPTVVGMSIPPSSTYLAAPQERLDIKFSGAVDPATLTAANFEVRLSQDPSFFDGNDQILADADGTIEWDPASNTASWQPTGRMAPGYYRIDLNGDAGGITSSAGQLLDGEFVNTYIAGNTTANIWNSSPSGDGIPGGDYVATFLISADSLWMAASPEQITENGGQSTVTVGRLSSDGIADPLVVQLATSPPSRASVPQSVTIPAGQSEATFVLTALDNNMVEGTQPVVVTATATDFESGQVALLIDDHEPLAMSIAPGTISENGGTATVTVTRPGTSGDLIVAISSSDDSQASYPALLTIPDGFTAASFLLVATDNQLLDGQRTLTLQATAAGHLNDQADVIIQDHEELSLAIAGDSIHELGGTTTAVVTRTDPTGTLIVRLSSSDTGEATVPSQVIIPAGQLNSSPFTITAVSDGVGDGTQTATVTATANGYVDADDTVDVLDAETLQIVFDDLQISENGGSTSARISRAVDGPELTVQLTATRPDDLSWPATVIIPAGQLESASFVVTAIDNDIRDGDRVVWLNATAPDYWPGQSPLTILDYEPLNVVVTGPAAISENGGSTTIVIRRADSTGQLVVDLNGNDATELNVPSQVIIPDGANESQPITLTAIDDNVNDGTQTVSISATSAAYDGGSVNIDVLDEEYFQIQAARSSIAENGGVTTVTVTRLNDDIDRELTVQLQSSDPTEINMPDQLVFAAGSATASFVVSGADDDDLDGTQTIELSVSAEGYAQASTNLDVTDHEQLALSIVAASISEYQGATTGTVQIPGPSTQDIIVRLSSSAFLKASVPGTVTIPAGQTSMDFSITALDNDLLDGDTLVQLGAQSTGFEFAIGSLTVTDFEELQIILPAAEVFENAGTITGSVVRPTGASGSEAIVQIANPSDRLQMPPVVTLAAGQSSFEFEITILDNSTLDGDLPISLVPSAEHYESILTQLTLKDYEPLTISFQEDSLSEDGGITQATLARGNSDIAEAVEVLLSVDVAGRLTFPSAVEIPAGQTSVDFEVQALDDALLSGPVPVQIFANADDYISDAATLTVLDAESLAVTFDVPQIQEDGGTGVVTVTRSNTNIDSELRVTLGDSPTGILNIPAQVTIPAGAQSVQFTTTGTYDPLVTGPRNVDITAIASGYSAGSGSVEVIENERLEIRSGISSISESQGTTVLTITRGSTSSLQAVDVSLSADTNGQIDLAATVQIPQGQSTVQVSVRAVDNDILDGERGIQILASAQHFLDGSFQLTITDHERLLVQLPQSSASESAGVLVATVSRENQDISQAVSVQLQSDQPGAVQLPTQVDIPAGQASATFEIQVLDNSAVNGNVQTQITATSTGYIDGSATLEVLDDDAFSWTNQVFRFDVNNDSFASPIDALIVINELNQNGSRQLPKPSSDPGTYYDVSEDEFLSPIDALLVINFLNSRGGGEGEKVGAVDQSFHEAPMLPGIAIPAVETWSNWLDKERRLRDDLVDQYFDDFI